jgi:hypothetical protein
MISKATPSSYREKLLNHPREISSYSLVDDKAALYMDTAHLAVQVAADRRLQAGRALADSTGQVLEIVTGSDAELADKVLGRGLQVAVILTSILLFGTAKVGI